MSISELLETGLRLVCLGVGVSLWVYAARHRAPVDVMLVLGNALRPANHPTQPEIDY